MLFAAESDFFAAGKTVARYAQLALPGMIKKGSTESGFLLFVVAKVVSTGYKCQSLL